MVLGLWRRLEGRSHRRVRDAQVLSQPVLYNCLRIAPVQLHERADSHCARGPRIHDRDARDVQDLLFPEQATRQVRRQAHPFPEHAGAPEIVRADLRRHLGSDRDGARPNLSFACVSVPDARLVLWALRASCGGSHQEHQVPPSTPRTDNGCNPGVVNEPWLTSVIRSWCAWWYLVSLVRTPQEA